MSSDDARPIGDFIPGILARTHRMAGFQAMLHEAGSPERRKAMIVVAFLGALISRDEADILMETISDG